MQLTEAVPWGRLASEYINMFALTPQDMKGRILDCAGGPSSFTTELTTQGRQVVSCDPLYQFTGEEIRNRIDATYPKMTAFRFHSAVLIWRSVPIFSSRTPSSSRRSFISRALSRWRAWLPK